MTKSEEELLACLEGGDETPWVPPKAVEASAKAPLAALPPSISPSAPPRTASAPRGCDTCATLLMMQLEVDESAARSRLQMDASDALVSLAISCFMRTCTVADRAPSSQTKLPSPTRAAGPDSDDDSDDASSGQPTVVARHVDPSGTTAAERRERDRQTYLANRRLLANDLIKELYEANASLKAQLQQVLQMVAMMNPAAAAALGLAPPAATTPAKKAPARRK